MYRSVFAHLVLGIALLLGGLAASSAAAAATSAIPRHVVVIVQENRTVDNLFLGYPGADTQAWGWNSHHHRVPLVPISLASRYDVGHNHKSFVVEFNNGAMNGWDLVSLDCDHGPRLCNATAYGYVPRSETLPYWQLADQFALADHVLQPNEGPSFPAHQYLIAGQAGRPMSFSENPTRRTGGCDVKGTRVKQIDLRLPYPGVEGEGIFPCKNYRTIFDLLDRTHHTWRYYTPSRDSIWAAPIAVRHLYDSISLKNVVFPETKVLRDIKTHQLPDVSYVIPRGKFSDHASRSTTGGPDWVGTIANAIGTDPYYWSNTAILITWDDWGGWFDHYPASHPNSIPNDDYEYGFRVPLIVVSPYVRRPHYVSHAARNATSILRFIEFVYGLPSLDQLDATTDDLHDMFNFNAPLPLPYHPVDAGRFTSDYFLSLPPDETPVDE